MTGGKRETLLDARKNTFIY